MDRRTKRLALACLPALLWSATARPARAEDAAGASASVESGMERAGAATKKGLDTAGSATGDALEKAMDATGRGIGYAIDKTGEGLKKAGDTLSGTEGSKSEEGDAD